MKGLDEMAKRITTLNDFMIWAQELPPGYLFRGVSNTEYKIEASTYRRLKGESGDEDRNPKRILDINNEMIKDANLHRHGWKNEESLSDLNLLSELQHLGAATCLIDFTKNPLVALWMACRKSSRRAKDGTAHGKVYAVDTGPHSKFKSVEIEEAQNEDLDYFFKYDNEEGYHLYQWQPNYQNSRMLAQQSIFLFGWDEIEPSAECIIVEDCKQEIRDSLKKSAGITGDILFPDFGGFASQRAENKPYEYDTDVSLGEDREDTEDKEDIAVDVGSLREAQAKLSLERGLQASREGNTEEAIRCYGQGISLEPGAPLLSRFYSERAIVYYNTKKFELAITDYGEAIRLDRTNAYNYYWRGRARYELKQYPDAIVDFDVAMNLNPNDSYFYYWRGCASFYQKDYLIARLYFDTAIKRNPDDPRFYYWRGCASVNLGQYLEAIVDFNAAIKRNPSDSYFYYWRGLAEYNLGQYSEANVDFGRAMNLNPTDPNFYYWRGRTNKRMNNFEMAKVDFRMGLTYASDKEDKSLVDKILREL